MITPAKVVSRRQSCPEGKCRGRGPVWGYASLRPPLTVEPTGEPVRRKTDSSTACPPLPTRVERRIPEPDFGTGRRGAGGERVQGDRSMPHGALLRRSPRLRTSVAFGRKSGRRKSQLQLSDCGPAARIPVAAPVSRCWNRKRLIPTWRRFERRCDDGKSGVARRFKRDSLAASGAGNPGRRGSGSYLPAGVAAGCHARSRCAAPDLGGLYRDASRQQ